VPDYGDISYSVNDRIATIALDRPCARNGYTVRMSDELADAFTRADADADVRVVVFTGEGNDFCVGADLSSGALDTSEDGAFDAEDWAEPAGRCSMRIFSMNKPVIAAIRGVVADLLRAPEEVANCIDAALGDAAGHRQDVNDVPAEAMNDEDRRRARARFQKNE
jgi:hypothetical protein